MFENGYPVCHLGSREARSLDWGNVESGSTGLESGGIIITYSSFEALSVPHPPELAELQPIFFLASLRSVYGI